MNGVAAGLHCLERATPPLDRILRPADLEQIRQSVLELQSGELAMPNFVTLLVEDDAFQREVLADILRDDGFEVVECTTAEAAELVISSAGTELQALITDHNLAGVMTGAELAAYARGKYPHLNIILMSGTATSPLPSNTLFLQKPFLPRQLLAAVRS
jgi:CheY-like chemotaxis protein